MLKLFVILISCAVVFEDSHGVMLSPTPSPTSSPKSTTAPKQSNSTMLSVQSLTSTPANQTTSAMNSRHSATPSIVTFTAKPSTPATNSTISPNSTIAPKPTLTPTPKNSTTPKPSTPKPTPTTPKPTTLPPPSGKFSLEENGTFCLLAEFVAAITVHYKKMNDTKPGKVVQYLNRTTRDDVSVKGDCGIGKTSSRLVLSWPKEKPLYELTMMFEELVAVSANSNKTMWEMSMITFKATVKGNVAFLNFSGNDTYVISKYNSSKDFGKPELGSYYKCEAAKRMQLGNDLGAKFKVDSSFSDLKLEPFANSTDGSFGNGTYTDCPEDKPTTSPSPSPTSSKNNDIVPIAVGCALAGLVLIVLIAYVIGRRKSHSGYEKV